MSIRQGSKIIAGMPDLSSKADKETTYTKEEVNSLIQNVEVDAYTKEEVNNLLENIDALPEQTDNSGKLLSTDGENALWIDAPSSLPTMDETTSGKLLSNNDGKAEWIENPDITMNGWNIFDHKFSDHLLNDPSWVRSDTFSWQDGGIYFTAYEELEKEFNDAYIANEIEQEVHYYGFYSQDGGHANIYFKSLTPSEGDISYLMEPGFMGYQTNLIAKSYDAETQTVAVYRNGDEEQTLTYFVREVESNDVVLTETVVETKEPLTDTYDDITITYYKSTNGLKICLQDQSDAIEQLYANTGVAWYYIIDTENKRFKLPRKVSETLDLNTVSVVGNGMTLGLTNGTTETGLITDNQGVVRCYSEAFGKDVSASSGPSTGVVAGYFGITTDPEKSGMIADLSSIGYKEVTEQTYLYFFMGDTLRDARIIDVNAVVENQASVTNELNALKNLLANIDYVVESKEATDEDPTWYRVYKSGWIEQGGTITHTDSQSISQTIS